MKCKVENETVTLRDQKDNFNWFDITKGAFDEIRFLGKSNNVRLVLKQGNTPDEDIIFELFSRLMQNIVDYKTNNEDIPFPEDFLDPRTETITWHNSAGGVDNTLKLQWNKGDIIVLLEKDSKLKSTVTDDIVANIVVIREDLSEYEDDDKLPKYANTYLYFEDFYKELIQLPEKLGKLEREQLIKCQNGGNSNGRC